jgi:hypothetical protein
MPWEMQTVIVPKSLAGSLEEATRIAKRVASKIYTSRETDSSYRFRQRPPEDFVAGTFRTSKLKSGVTVIYGEIKS